MYKPLRNSQHHPHASFKTAASSILLLWCVFSAGLATLGLVEWCFWCWWGGIRYVPDESLHPVRIDGFSISTDGQHAISSVGFRKGSRDTIINDIALHDITSRTTQALRLSDIKPRLATLSPNGKIIAIASDDGSVYLVPNESEPTSKTRSRRRTLVLSKPSDAIHHTNVTVRKLVFSPNSEWLAVVRQDVYRLRVSCQPSFESQKLQTSVRQRGRCDSHRACHAPVRTAPHRLCGLADGGPVSIAFSRDSKRLILLDGASHLSHWKTQRCTKLTTRDLLGHSPLRTALSRCGELAALVDSSGTLHCWETGRKTKRWQRTERTLRWHYHGPSALVFTPDHSVLVIIGRNRTGYALHCLDARTANRLKCWPNFQHSFKGITFASNDIFYGWDLRAGVRRCSLMTGRQNWRLACHRDFTD